LCRADVSVVFIPVLAIRVLFNSAVTTMPVSGIPSCSSTAQSHVIMWTYILLVIAETEILLSTLYQAVRYYREVGGASRLLAILVQHNTFYFFCSLGEDSPASIFHASQRTLRDLSSVFCDSDCDDIFSPGPIL